MQRFQQLAGGRLHRSAAQWGVARALETAGDLYGALDRVERLLAEYRAGRADTPGLLLLLNAQCRLYRDVGDLDHSVTIGENALVEVRALGLAGTEDRERLTALARSILGLGATVVPTADEWARYWATVLATAGSLDGELTVWRRRAIS